MEEKEQRIWQRVMGDREQSAGAELRQLIVEAMTRAAVYQKAYQRAKSSPKELIGQLYRGETEILQCLRGIWLLQTGEVPRFKPVPLEETPGKKCWIKHYHISRRTMAEFMARSAEPEYGCVFRYLSQCQERQCARLAQLLGTGNEGKDI